MEQVKKIVTIGGGKGQPELLRCLRDSGHEITAIVSMMDNGGSSGILRKAYGVLPPGDLRRCLVALSPRNGEFSRWWNYRFSQGPFEGHPVGNLFLAALTLEYGSIEQAIAMASEILGIRGRVLPVTLESAHLVAQLEDGTVIEGEEKIDLPTHNDKLHIEKLWLKPTVTTTDAVRKALCSADLIILSMGDLYTSILPNLLVHGVREAMAESQAQVVAVCNRSTKRGETHDFTCKQFYEVLTWYLAPVRIDHFIVDSCTIPLPLGVQPIDTSHLPDTVHLMQEDIADPKHPEHVSGEKVATLIAALCTS